MTERRSRRSAARRAPAADDAAPAAHDAAERPSAPGGTTGDPPGGPVRGVESSRTSASGVGVGGLLRRLRLLLAGDQAPGPEVQRNRSLGVAGPEVEFAAYAEDCLVFGYLRLDADRLTDTLNEHDAYAIVDTLVVALEDGRSIDVGALTVRRDEVLAVRATGPRGNLGRRSRVRPFPVALGTGPYTIHGYVHTPPGADPLLHVRRRRPMVPITEAWIEYAVGAAPQRGRVGALIVNRELIDWIGLADDEEIRLPDLPPDLDPGPLVKDFTGYILDPRP